MANRSGTLRVTCLYSTPLTQLHLHRVASTRDNSYIHKKSCQRGHAHIAQLSSRCSQACSTLAAEDSLEGAETETSAHEAQTWSLSSQSHLAGVRARVSRGEVMSVRWVRWPRGRTATGARTAPAGAWQGCAAGRPSQG